MMHTILFILVALLIGCGGTVVHVDGHFPDPLVEQMPLKMGVYYSEEFRNYNYEIEDKKKGNYSISTGSSQVRLFDTLFAQFFSETRQLSVLPSNSAPIKVNAVLAPEVEELQFTIPRETRSQIFEVWVKYKMRLYSAAGAPLLNWPITAYGKTPKAFMKSREEALEQAAIVALRDAGANFATSFNRVPKLRRWLNDELNKGAGDMSTEAVYPHSNKAAAMLDQSIAETEKMLRE